MLVVMARSETLWKRVGALGPLTVPYLRDGEE
jgi:hypothetical protein